MGIAFTYMKPDNNPPETFAMAHDFGISYFSISLSLDILLTLMIITRLVLHNMAIRVAPETPAGAIWTYKAIVTMLVESFALRAGSFLLFIGTWASGSGVEYLFFPILAATEVCTAFPCSCDTVTSRGCFLTRSQTGHCPLPHNSPGG